MATVGTSNDSERNGNLPAVAAIPNEFLEALFAPDDLVLVRPIETWTEGGKKRSRTIFQKTRCFKPHALLHPTTWGVVLRGLESEQANGFFGVCPRVGGQHDLAWQIRTVRALWADLDHCTPEEARQRCQAASIPPPSMVVRSGHGVHLYWLLAEPLVISDAGVPPPVRLEFRQRDDGKKVPFRWYADPASGERVFEFLDDAKRKKNPLWPSVSPQGRHVQHVIAGLAQALGGDHTQDLARLLRLPGTLNRKDQRNGKNPVPCELLECDAARRYPLADFEKFAEREPQRIAEEAAAKVRLKSGVKLTAARRNKLSDFLNACAVAEDRSSADFALCCWAIEQGLAKEEVWAECQGVGKFAQRGRDYFDLTWDKAEQKTRRRVYDRACRKQARQGTAPHTQDGAGAPPRLSLARASGGSGPRLPSIQGNQRQLRDVTADALAALLARNDPLTIFQRGGVLARLRIRPENDAPELEPLVDAALRGVLARVADWQRVRDTPHGPVAEADAPPVEVVKDLANLPGWEGVPILEAIIECPAFARTGELVQTPGFHPAARLLYRPASGLQVPPIPNRPTATDIVQARDLLLIDLLGDFPFADEASKAHALAALLLFFVRPLIDGPTPLHLFDAPVEGTGKTLLVKILTIVATGREVEGLSETGDTEEWRKRITAALAAAPAYVFIDNLNRVLDAGALASVLTATTWKDRVLGLSKTTTLPNTCVWLASGNNSRLSRELIRRTLWCRLDARRDAPWERTGFRHPNLVVWTKAQRGRLVAAALTLVQGWIAAGKPAGTQTLGMFESWVEVVGGILDVAGVPGLLVNAKEFRGSHADKVSEWRAFVVGWWQEHADRPVGVEELFVLVTQQKLLDSVVGDKGERSQRTRLGVALGKATDRVVGEYRIEHAGEDHKGRQQYRLSRNQAEPVVHNEVCQWEA